MILLETFRFADVSDAHSGDKEWIEQIAKLPLKITKEVKFQNEFY